MKEKMEKYVCLLRRGQDLVSTILFYPKLCPSNKNQKSQHRLTYIRWLKLNLWRLIILPCSPLTLISLFPLINPWLWRHPHHPSVIPCPPPPSQRPRRPDVGVVTPPCVRANSPAVARGAPAMLTLCPVSTASARCAHTI